MDTFWDRSWACLEPSRLENYIHTFDMEADDIIRLLQHHRVQSVCDAGCGCGIYALKLAANGFDVSGFDVSAHAVELACNLSRQAAVPVRLKTANILATGYADGRFDGTVSRDVLDHMKRDDACAAIQELLRITKPNGIVLFTLDAPDGEYETEPHTVTASGDYVFTDGKWKGMVFHPYGKWEIQTLIPAHTVCEITEQQGHFTVLLRSAR